MGTRADPRAQRMSSYETRELFGRVYQTGDVLFREGEPGQEMFVIQDGSVEISSVVDGQKMVYGVLGKGSFFGEMALFDDKPRSATASVMSSARLMLVTRETLQERLQTDPFMALSLLRSMCTRLRALHQSLEDLIAKESIDPQALEATLRAHRPS